MIRILFVCLGNICRSPLAEGIFTKLLEENGWQEKVSCASAGTAAYHVGQVPDPRTMDIANSKGVLIDHKGQQFSSEDFHKFNYVVVMDRSNLKDVLAKGGETGKNVFLMRHFDSIDKNSDVPDPYYGAQSGFEEMFHILSRSCKGLVDYIASEHRLLES